MHLSERQYIILLEWEAIWKLYQVAQFGVQWLPLMCQSSLFLALTLSLIKLVSGSSGSLSQLGPALGSVLGPLSPVLVRILLLDWFNKNPYSWYLTKYLILHLQYLTTLALLKSGTLSSQFNQKLPYPLMLPLSNSTSTDPHPALWLWISICPIVFGLELDLSPSLKISIAVVPVE